MPEHNADLRLVVVDGVGHVCAAISRISPDPHPPPPAVRKLRHQTLPFMLRERTVEQSHPPTHGEGLARPFFEHVYKAGGQPTGRYYIRSSLRPAPCNLAATPPSSGPRAAGFVPKPQIHPPSAINITVGFRSNLVMFAYAFSSLLKCQSLLVSKVKAFLLSSIS